jgi:hypothetical protein
MGTPLGDTTTVPLITMAGLSATGTPSSSTYLRGDGTWSSPAGAGTVTSVAMSGDGVIFSSSVTGSPITSNGTLAPSLIAQTANTFLCGPSSAGPTAPTFRTIATADVPTLNQSTTGSAASLSVSGQTGLLTVTGLASTNRAKTVRDAADTLLELGGSYTPTGTWTSLTMVTPVLGTPTSGTLTNCTFPTLNQNTTGSANSLAAGHAVTNAQFPQGITNFNSALQSTGQLTAATPVYLTSSNLNLPASLVNGIVVGTAFRWRIALTKNANGTGATSLLIFLGTNGTTGDSAKVTQAITGTATAAVDTMTVDVHVVFTAVGASGAFFWTMTPIHQAATATGFGVTTSTGAFTGTVASVNTTTASLIFGLGVQVATGGTLPTFTVPLVEAKAFNLD